MRTYSILGGTGATGRALINHLLADGSSTINIYVRSASKLESQQPDIGSNPRVRIYAGAMSDVSLIASCIQSTHAVFSVLASNGSVPGIRIAQDTAQTIVAACCQLRTQDPGTKLPRIIALSAAPLSDEFTRTMPAVGLWVLMRAEGYLYEDLRRAEQFYRLFASWLTVTFVQPGGLTDGVPASGYRVLTKGGDKSPGFMGYADLAAGMIEVAVQTEVYDWKAVTVVPVVDAPMGQGLPLMILTSLMWWFFPWAYTLTH